MNPDTKKLLEECHLEKMSDRKEDVYFYLTVITVKQDELVEIAVKVRALNLKMSRTSSVSHFKKIQ